MNYYLSDLGFQKGTRMKQYDVEYFRIAVLSKNLSKNHYDGTIPMPIARSPIKKTIETPTYNMASIIIVFPFHPANAAY